MYQIHISVQRVPEEFKVIGAVPGLLLPSLQTKSPNGVHELAVAMIGSTTPRTESEKKTKGIAVGGTWRRTSPRCGRAVAERWLRSAATRRSRLPACRSMGTAGGAREEEAAMAGSLRVPCCLGLDRTPKLVIYWRRENLCGPSNANSRRQTVKRPGLAMNWAGPF
jgi:hypothetical protein